MRDYLLFLEEFSTNEHLYTRTFDKKGREWEIHWSPAEFGEINPWKFNKMGANFKYYINTDSVEDFMSHMKLNTQSLKAEAISNIKGLLVLAEIQKEEAKKLLGEGVVDEAMAEHKAFCEVMSSALREFFPNQPKKPKLTLVKK